MLEYALNLIPSPVVKNASIAQDIEFSHIKKNVEFISCTFTGDYFKQTDHVTFRECTFLHVEFLYAIHLCRFYNCTFTMCTWLEEIINNCILEKCTFNKCNLIEVDFYKTHMTKVVFLQCHLEGVQIDRSFKSTIRFKLTDRTGVSYYA